MPKIIITKFQKRKQAVKTRVKKRVKLALLPHKANQYRPRAVGRVGIVVILLLIIGIQAGYNSLTHGNVLGVAAQITPDGLLNATNEMRTQNNEPDLISSPRLAKAAQLKVNDMFKQQYWAHKAPDGTTPWYWFGTVGYVYKNAGENLAKDFTTNDNTVSAWMASPTHRANILKKEYTEVGFAVKDGLLNGEPTTLIVALYATPDTTGVQGVTALEESSTNKPLSFMARLGLGLQALTPAAVSSVVVLFIATNIALIAHIYRKKLPIELRRSWYRHHGIYKAIGFVSIAIIIVFAYGNIGQI